MVLTVVWDGTLLEANFLIREVAPALVLVAKAVPRYLEVGQIRFLF